MGHCLYTGLDYQRMGNYILKGEELSRKLRELAILRVGDLAQSEFELKQHSAIALRCGITQKQIDEISDWISSDAFDEEERAVLVYTDEVAVDVKVKDETFNNLRGFLDDHAIVELTAAIGYYGMIARILVALHVELDDEA